ncbi:lipid binding protein [Phaffia rhodozyma]|uniref:Sorting nexin-4 n=1 Tax=Phaffia rhodozyma TaxID=264483 RepID=A0A0F7SHW9_PHARH|nr:lipid binding protein [Phaffia rhodozyma]
MPSTPDENVFDSVQWDTIAIPQSPTQADDPESAFRPIASPSSGPQSLPPPTSVPAEASSSSNSPHRTGVWGSNWVEARIMDYKIEGGKDKYVTYGLRVKTNLPTFTTTDAKVRRRFQDFVFLHDNLAKDFPACIVPPLPDKHRIEYLPGRDRFGPEFLEKRIEDLQRFISRLTRHPTLRRSTLFASFLEATDWNIRMHKHLANPPNPEAPSSILESISDSIVNLTSGKVRKPDERFEEMRGEVERFEYGLAGVNKGAGRLKGRTGDLASDYNDFAQSIKELAYLESGITEPLVRFADRMTEFSNVLRHVSTTPLPPFISHLESLLHYSQTHRALLALRDQKQLDSEILSEYLTSVVLERDRLSSLVENGGVPPGGPVGIGTYLKDRVDALRGKDDIASRRERMKRLDGRIKELQEAVVSAVDTSNAFSDETLREHENFELDKKEEMKEVLGEFADAQIEMYQKAMDDWDKVIPILNHIRVDI